MATVCLVLAPIGDSRFATDCHRLPPLCSTTAPPVIGGFRSIRLRLRRFVTTTSTRASARPGTGRPVPPLVVDLFVDGQDHAEGQIEHTSERTLSLEGELLGESESEPVTLRFDGLAEEDKKLEVWLPTWA